MTITTELPTTTKLGISSSDVSGIDAAKVSQEWLDSFSQAASRNDAEGILLLLTEDAWWRDLLALTWNFRSFQGRDKIKQFLHDCLANAKLSNFKLTLSGVDQMWDDLAWVRGHYTFDTEAGEGSGIFRIVPVKTPGGGLEWKAHSVATNLESLKGFPEAIGSLRNFAPNHGKWLDQRQRESEYLDKDPEVLVVGGGQSGLEIAARLKVLGVETLVCEKQARVGDQWRHRYAALCLHDVVCEYTRAFALMCVLRYNRVRSHAIPAVRCSLPESNIFAHCELGSQKIGRCFVRHRRCS